MTVDRLPTGHGSVKFDLCRFASNTVVVHRQPQIGPHSYMMALAAPDLLDSVACASHGELNQAAIGPDGIVRFLSLAQVDLRKWLASLLRPGIARPLSASINGSVPEIPHFAVAACTSFSVALSGSISSLFLHIGIPATP